MDFIPICKPKLYGNEKKYIEECLNTNCISSQGRFIGEFEDKFANYCGVKYGASTTSGTTALHLAMSVLGIGKGDEVIMPTLTIISCPNAVSINGAIMILVDSEYETWNIDADKIEEKITEKTKAIMIVHTYGHPVNMEKILSIARKYNLYIIEDAAEAHGAEFKGQKVGSFGDIAVFSFYSNKIITTGEGGMLITNNKDFYEHARRLKNLAFLEHKRFWHEEIGYNYRMTNIQAAIGVAQLEHIEESIGSRRKNAELYKQYLKDIGGVITAPECTWAKNIFWYYSILIGEDFGIKRDNVVEILKEKGIDSRTFFYPIHQQPVYKDLFYNKSFPVADDLAMKGINLPSSNDLTEDEIAYIAKTLRGMKKL